MRRFLISSIVTVALFACTDVTAPPRPEAIDRPVTVQASVVASVNTHFMFLPPMAQGNTTVGVFDPNVSPRVEICEMTGQACAGYPLAVFTMTSGPGSETVRVSPSDELYIVNWQTDRFALRASKVYSVRIFLQDALIGFANLFAYSDNAAVQSIDQSQFIPLKIGRTLPIKFRIEKGLVVAMSVVPNPMTVAVGKTASFSVTLTDAHGQTISDESVVWTTSNATVATVSANGLVTGVSTGSVTATATSGLINAAAQVIVIPPPVAVVSIVPNSARLGVATSLKLVAGLADADGNALTDRAIAWSTSDASVATVDNQGVVTGVALGVATITATSEGKAASVPITVVPAPVAVVAVTPSSATLAVRNTVQLAATLTDANGNTLGNRTVSWTSSDASIASVDASGLVSALTPGSATVTATSEGKSGTSQVTVTPVAVASVTVSPSSRTISSNEIVALLATSRDGNGNVVSGPAVAWSSSNTSVATVDANGRVTGDQAGTATITATVSGITGTAEITVAGCSNACAVRLTGHVTFSDGRTASGVTVILGGVTPQPSAVADIQGNYSLLVAAANYSIDVAFNAGGVSTQGRSVAPSFALTVNTVRNLVVPTITLRGRVIDDLGTPVPNVVFHVGAFAKNVCCGAFDNITLTSGNDGTFSANILPNDYTLWMSLTPPGGSPYVTTALPNFSWTTDVAQDFVIQRSRTMSGIVRYPDGAVAPGVSVIASSSLGLQTSAVSDVQGYYNMILTPGIYSLDVALSAGGVVTQGLNVASSLQVDQSVVHDITLPTVRLRGRVVDDLGTPVSNVVFHVGAFAKNVCCGGLDNITLTSGSDGTFSANIPPNNYTLWMSLTPPGGSPYVTTALPNFSWTTDVSQDFVIQRSRTVSGIVRYPDGAVAPGVSVIASSSLGLQTSAVSDVQGYYNLTVAPETYSLDVAYSLPGFSTQGRSVGTQVQVSQDVVRDLAIPSVTWSGIVVDGDGTPVTGVTLRASASASNNCCGGWDNVHTVTGADGRFSVEVLPNQYTQVYLTPPPNSIYVDTPLANQSINAKTEQSFVIVRKP